MSISISIDEYCQGIFGSNEGRKSFEVQVEDCFNYAKRETTGGGSSARDNFCGQCGRGFHRRVQVTDIFSSSVSSCGVPAPESERWQASRFIVRDYEAVLASMDDTGRINAGDVQSTDYTRAIFSALLLCKERENATTAWRSDVSSE